MKMKRVTLVLLLHSILVCGQTGQDWSYPVVCASRNTTMLDPHLPAATSTPPLPVLPNAFQLRVEANLLDMNRTVVAEEFYDASTNRAAVHLFENNTLTIIIFDYINNQSFYFLNDTCRVTDLDDNTKIFGLHVLNSKATLNFAKSNGLLYKGTQVVRGIECDWWQSCMYWPSLRSNFTLDYYFSAYSWTPADKSRQVPVRAEVSGVSHNIQPTRFHHRYEYFDFRDKIWRDETVFETPQGVICIGRKQTKQVPVLPEQMSYRLEIVQTKAQDIAKKDIYYDRILKLLRVDYVTDSLPPYNTETTATEIHDFNTGIVYSIDTVRGNCTQSPMSLTDSSFSNIVYGKDGEGSFYRLMKSPEQFFYLDNKTYTYEGTRTVRGILCDVFISSRTDFELPLIFEVYFMAHSWATTNFGSSTAVPVQLRITKPGLVGYIEIYNIYNYVAKAASLDKFQFASCFNESSKRQFKIEFPGSWDDSLMQYRNLLIQQNTMQVSSVTHVSPSRVQNGQIFVYPDKFYFVATLLEQPANIELFTKLPRSYSWSMDDKKFSVTNVEDCADLCIIQPENCYGFYYCSDRDQCVLKESMYTTKWPGADWPSGQRSQLECPQYIFTVQRSDFEPSSAVAWTNLRNMIFYGGYRLSINTSGQVTTIKAASVYDNIIQNPRRTLSARTSMDHFTEQREKMISGYGDMIYTGLSIDECASECLGEQSWSCNSFQFCFDTGYCVLYKLHPDEHPNAVKNALLCDLFTKKYSVDYQKLPGITVSSNSDIFYQNVNTADQCAKLCSLYEDFSCKSFDFCDDINTCYLGRSHFYDIPKADMENATMCTHYSRKHLADFKILQRMELPTSYIRIVRNVSADQCAKLCVEVERINCASFSYCGNTSECVLSNVTATHIGQAISQRSLMCDVYSRQSFPDGTPFTAQSTTCVSPSQSTAGITSISEKTTQSSSKIQFLSIFPSSNGQKTEKTFSLTTQSSSKSQSHSIFPSSTRKKTGLPTSSISSSKFQTFSSLSPQNRHVTGKTVTTQNLGTSIPLKDSNTQPSRDKGLSGGLPTSSKSSSKFQTFSSLSPRNRHVTGKTATTQNLGTSIPLKDSNTQPSRDKGLSGGAIAGLAIGMMLAGILIAFIVYVGFTKLRGKTLSDMKVPFVRHDMELN